MDVSARKPARWLPLLAGCLCIVLHTPAQADPIYTFVDLGTGNLSFGSGTSGNGTVTGSTGLTYRFNPVQSYLPSQRGRAATKDGERPRIEHG